MGMRTQSTLNLSKATKASSALRGTEGNRNKGWVRKAEARRVPAPVGGDGPGNERENQAPPKQARVGAADDAAVVEGLEAPDVAPVLSHLAPPAEAHKEAPSHVLRPRRRELGRVGAAGMAAGP